MKYIKVTVYEDLPKHELFQMAWPKLIKVREITVLFQYSEGHYNTNTSTFLTVSGENRKVSAADADMTAILHRTACTEPNTGSNPAHSTHWQEC